MTKYRPTHVQKMREARRVKQAVREVTPIRRPVHA